MSPRKVAAGCRQSLGLMLVTLLASACGPELPRGTGEDAFRATLAALAGSWKSDLNADSLIIEPDGRFRWGRPYSGRFSVFSNGRVFMSLRENGRLLGGTPLLLTQSADTVRLTPSDGTQMAFYRVVEEQR